MCAATQYIVDNVDAILSCMRRCNVSLRWVLLHRLGDGVAAVRDFPLSAAFPTYVATSLLSMHLTDPMFQENHSEAPAGHYSARNSWVPGHFYVPAEECGCTRH